MATAGRWRFPSLQHNPDRLGFLLVGQWAAIFGLSATDPHLFLLYVCCTTGAHQPSTGWAPPIRARVKARLVRWAQTVEINTNIKYSQVQVLWKNVSMGKQLNI